MFTSHVHFSLHFSSGFLSHITKHVFFLFLTTIIYSGLWRFEKFFPYSYSKKKARDKWIFIEILFEIGRKNLSRSVNSNFDFVINLGKKSEKFGFIYSPKEMTASNLSIILSSLLAIFYFSTNSFLEGKSFSKASSNSCTHSLVLPFVRKKPSTEIQATPSQANNYKLRIWWSRITWLQACITRRSEITFKWATEQGFISRLEYETRHSWTWGQLPVASGYVNKVWSISPHFHTWQTFLPFFLLIIHTKNYL